jgi:hypothetical protein
LTETTTPCRAGAALGRHDGWHTVVETAVPNEGVTLRFRLACGDIFAVEAVVGRYERSPRFVVETNLA